MRLGACPLFYQKSGYTIYAFEPILINDKNMLYGTEANSIPSLRVFPLSAMGGRPSGRLFPEISAHINFDPGQCFRDWTELSCRLGMFQQIGLRQAGDLGQGVKFDQRNSRALG